MARTSATSRPARPREAKGGQPKLYNDLASWFHLLTDPKEYAEEARFYRRTLAAACKRRPRTVLELGSGGGNNASHMKKHFEMTLTDLSPAMLALSKTINPGLEHVQGDMRTLRLGREFDAVFAHDAIVYMTTERDLRRAVETAYVHCKRGGAALFAPDYTRETFQSSADCGGHDDPKGLRGLRYLEWTWDPNPTDTKYSVEYVYLLRDAKGGVRVERDRHLEGLFPRATWLRLLRETGFRARAVPFKHSELVVTTEVFVGVKP
jgi:SAM-dependent methyltransferase